ncbi:MAG: 4Fe-4S dicluster domain-containing protein, partial [Cyclobacteriaceae bacterium]|nr:4Fe-4S dicluster domain-containing protein [Cyclobacteriaceae bacterium]
SFGADFLGTWISPIEYTKQYSQTRKVSAAKKEMSRHIQFEANLSLTGANADYRIAVKPSQQGLAVAALYNAIAQKSGAASLSVNTGEIPYIKETADQLWNARGKSLVVSGSNDSAVQVIVNAINDLLGNYGSTVDVSGNVNYRQGDDKSMDAFISALSGGNVGAVIFYNCNPVYNHPRGAELAENLSKVKLSLSTSDRLDETSSKTIYVAPDHHFLESWGDSEPSPGKLSLKQPVITNLFNTRQAQESFLRWSGSSTSYFDYLQNRWQGQYYSTDLNYIDFQTFWDSVFHDGVFEYKQSVGSLPTESSAEPAEEIQVAEAKGFSGNISEAGAAIAKNYKGEGIELALYFKVGIGDGTQANNPWLQEMPDPVTKATWDNYLTVSQAFAHENNISSSEGKVNKAKLTVNGVAVDLPVLIQPGQANGTVGLALGYGRTVAGKVADNVGVNAYPFVSKINGSLSFDVFSGISIEVLSDKYQVAQTQTHETYMNRSFVIQETTLGDYKEDPFAGRKLPKISTWKSPEGNVSPNTLSLWEGHQYPDHHWGLAIDLNSCTGCSSCTIACQAENNVPVVGREEVVKRREMHWIRIDRYYSSDAAPSDRQGLEKAAENPEVVFQPMMCQHCNNAPCETVCPVAATTHSTEGLNQMVYNRCIGTRYCANNCPYKVRRFNWFKYHDNNQFAGSNTLMNSDLGKMVLNPDVTVRSRGVMEKCSMCVQRIQYGKLEAKKEKRKLKDGDINMACASSCPADALVFGDLNDPQSKISQLLKVKAGEKGIDKEIGEERAYVVLEEVGVKPNVTYLSKVRNKEV